VNEADYETPISGITVQAQIAKKIFATFVAFPLLCMTFMAALSAHGGDRDVK